MQEDRVGMESWQDKMYHTLPELLFYTHHVPFSAKRDREHGRGNAEGSVGGRNLPHSNSLIHGHIKESRN